MLPSHTQMLARSPFAGTPVVHVGDEVCAGLLPLRSFLEAAQSSVLIKPVQRLSWGAPVDEDGHYSFAVAL